MKKLFRYVPDGYELVNKTYHVFYLCKGGPDTSSCITATSPVASLREKEQTECFGNEVTK